MAKFTNQEDFMYITSQLPQQNNSTKINEVSTVCHPDKSSTYQVVSEKINACMQNKNLKSTPEMIEKFYLKLLPITYRDWLGN